MRLFLIFSAAFVASVFVYLHTGNTGVQTAQMNQPTSHVINFTPPNIRSQEALMELTPLPIENQASKTQEGGQMSQNDKDLIVAGRQSVKDGMAFLDSHYTGEARERALNFMVAELGRDRLSVIAELAPLFRSRNEFQFAISGLTKYWVAKDADTFVKFADKQPGGLRSQLLQYAVSALADRQNLEEAAGIIERLPFSRERTSAIDSLASKFAQGSPEMAIAWAAKLPLQEDIDRTQRTIYAGLSSKGDVAGLWKLSEGAPKSLKPAILASIGTILGSQENSSPQLLNNVSAADREVVISGMMRSATPSQMDSLMGETRNFQSKYIRAQAVNTYVGRVFDLDQQKAIQWVTNAPPEIRADATAGLVNRWYHADSMAASDWINSLRGGSDRDVALGTLAGLLQNSDLAAARDVASKISDVSSRNNLLQRLK